MTFSSCFPLGSLPADLLETIIGFLDSPNDVGALMQSTRSLCLEPRRNIGRTNTPPPPTAVIAVPPRTLAAHDRGAPRPNEDLAMMQRWIRDKSATDAGLRARRLARADTKTADAYIKAANKKDVARMGRLLKGGVKKDVKGGMVFMIAGRSKRAGNSTVWNALIASSS